MGKEDKIWRSIIEIARRSPSTHNTQGWKIAVVSPREAELLYDSERTLPAEDINGDFNIINMGIFTRGAEIAAASMGYDLLYDFPMQPLHPPSRYTRIANLSLRNAVHAQSVSLLPLFLKRRTSRIPYDGRPINEEHVRVLQQSAHDRGHQFSWTQNPEDVRRIMELNADTISEDLQRGDVRNELHQWMRFTDREAREKGDGLWTRCMNQNSLLAWFTTINPTLLQFGWIKRCARAYYLKTQSGTPAIGWIAGSIATRREQFEAGRFFLDFWLELTRHGIWILPYGSLYTNPASNKQIGEQIGAPNFWLIFRMGYGATPPQSFRLPTEELFL